MSDKNINAPFEDFIKKILKGNTQKNALDFAAFLKANDITTGENHSTLIYNGNVLAWMHMDGQQELPGPWTIWPDLTGTVPEGFIFDDAMKEIAWQNVNICAKCGGDCAPGSSKSIFGKDFMNVCGAILAFTDPGSITLECVKRLMEMRKHVVDFG
jgi:hypothetical protein